MISFIMTTNAYHTNRFQRRSFIVVGKIAVNGCSHFLGISLFSLCWQWLYTLLCEKGPPLVFLDLPLSEITLRIVQLGLGGLPFHFLRSRRLNLSLCRFAWCSGLTSLHQGSDFIGCASLCVLGFLIWCATLAIAGCEYSFSSSLFLNRQWW